MRKILPMFAVMALTSGMAMALTSAAEKTYKGEAMCAKCALKEQATCQNVVKVEEAGKTVTYYIKHDAVSKKAHSGLGICTAAKDAGIKVVVTGDDEEKDGKKIITATKIEKEEDK